MRDLSKNLNGERLSCTYFNSIDFNVETLILWQLNRGFCERAAAKEPTELFTKNTGLC